MCVCVCVWTKTQSVGTAKYDYRSDVFLPVEFAPQESPRRVDSGARPTLVKTQPDNSGVNCFQPNPVSFSSINRRAQQRCFKLVPSQAKTYPEYEKHRPSDKGIDLTNGIFRCSSRTALAFAAITMRNSISTRTSS